MSIVTRRPLIFAAFVSSTLEHAVYGAWRSGQPGSDQADFNSLSHWISLAKTLEAGKFDLIFFSDALGLSGDFNGSWKKFVEAGIFFPSNDPSSLVSALAASTENLGIAFTSSIIQDHPFHFARRMSTLDHLSNGRVAWNIVTTGLSNSARNFGMDLVPHDERYIWAEEYIDVLYKLWEGSWDDGALVQDIRRGIHADFTKVHKIFHESARYKIEGPHLVSPSPQRTPFLFQAGSSAAGRDFSARNSEGVFITGGVDPNVIHKTIADVRNRAVGYGRSADDLRFFLPLSFVVGSTEEEALRRESELEEIIDVEAELAHLGGSMGFDLGNVGMDQPIADVEVEGIRSLASWLKSSVSGRPPVVRDLASLVSKGSRIVGTPEGIADRLAQLRDVGLDGVNMINVNRPGSYVEFIKHVMPVLRDRGLAQTDYRPGTLRHKLFGQDRLPSSHPAAKYRGAFSDSSFD